MHNIFFRVDSSLRIGTGHVMRCLTLAKALKKRHFNIYFICRPHLGHLGDYIEKQGFNLLWLPNLSECIEPTEDSNRKEYAKWLGTTNEEDAQQTQALLNSVNKKNSYGLIVDHYGIDARWHQILKKKIQTLLVIDDLADRQYIADILLDQTADREKQDYLDKVPENCQLLLGGNYSLLREEFSLWKPISLQRRSGEFTLKNILIYMGTDQANITTFVINALEKIVCLSKVEIIVVLSQESPHHFSVSKVIEESSLSIRLLSNPNMAELMAKADLAIGACGMTSWERCCLGLPTLLVVTANNQKDNAQQLVKAGAATLLGAWPNIKEEDIISAVKMLVASPKILQQMSENALNCVSEFGTLNVVESFLALSKPNVEIRDVEEKDLDTIYQWQILPGIRKYSRNPKAPAYSEHCIWFNKMLSDANKKTFIVKWENNEVGLLRCDQSEEKQGFEISILMDPRFQRKKIAEQALRLLQRKYKKSVLWAYIHPENIASIKLFNKVGFKKTDCDWYRFL